MWVRSVTVVRLCTCVVQFETRKYCQHDFNVLFAPSCGRCSKHLNSSFAGCILYCAWTRHSFRTVFNGCSPCKPVLDSCRLDFLHPYIPSVWERPKLFMSLTQSWSVLHWCVWYCSHGWRSIHELPSMSNVWQLARKKASLKLDETMGKPVMHGLVTSKKTQMSSCLTFEDLRFRSPLVFSHVVIVPVPINESINQWISQSVDYRSIDRSMAAPPERHQNSSTNIFYVSFQ